MNCAQTNLCGGSFVAFFYWVWACPMTGFGVGKPLFCARLRGSLLCLFCVLLLRFLVLLLVVPVLLVLRLLAVVLRGGRILAGSWFVSFRGRLRLVLLLVLLLVLCGLSSFRVVRCA
jgi:hypothetical protein